MSRIFSKFKNIFKGKKNSSTLVLIIVIAIIAIVAIVYSQGVNKNYQSFDQIINPPTEQTTTQTTPEPEPESVGEQTSGASVQPVSISYNDALTTYAGRIIQLDSICQAHPTAVTYKDNTGIMIDNRSPYTRTVTVGTTFTIKPYGFKIVVLPDVYLKLKTLFVACDKSQNVATVIVQE